mmetsp:Transcript_116316/g.329629  ORF Transcript_116316/g.329629 Transcript_116316/m.329629 type:complete len:236 (+) Transcript_116316:3-710(+)
MLVLAGVVEPGPRAGQAARGEGGQPGHVGDLPERADAVALHRHEHGGHGGALGPVPHLRPGRQRLHARRGRRGDLPARERRPPGDEGPGRGVLHQLRQPGRAQRQPHRAQRPLPAAVHAVRDAGVRHPPGGPGLRGDPRHGDRAGRSDRDGLVPGGLPQAGGPAARHHREVPHRPHGGGRRHGQPDKGHHGDALRNRRPQCSPQVPQRAHRTPRLSRAVAHGEDRPRRRDDDRRH